MSFYSELKPIYASSLMIIYPLGSKLKFINSIIYDYLDLGKNKEWRDYRSYLSDEVNRAQEIKMNWENLQGFLDQEINKINTKLVKLHVQHCNIQFRSERNPYVEWNVEFTGVLDPNTNIYENFVDPEILEYPIYSKYIFDEVFKVKEVKSALHFAIDPSKRIIEYIGEPGDLLDGYEAIHFEKLKK